MELQMSVLRKLWPFLLPHKGKIFLATLCSAANKICDIVPEILIGISIDVIVNQDHSLVARLGISNPFHQLYIVGAFTALLWILESVFEYFYAILWRTIAQDIQHDIRIKTYAQLQDLDTVYFENKTTGGLLAILHDDIQQLEQFLSESPNAIIQLVVNVVVMGMIFLYLSPLLSFFAVLPIPFVVLIAHYFQERLAILYAQLRERTGTLASHIGHRLQGISTIKSYTTQFYEIHLLKQESALHKKAQYKAARLNAAYVPVVRMGIMVGFISSLVMGGRYALLGYLPINWYAALVFLTQRFLWPFTTITLITDMYERTKASLKRIFAILHEHPSIKDGSEILDIKKMQGAIQFDNVSFAYKNGAQIFSNLSLKILARTTVAFVGTTGSGKSTIIKLLLRFYDANRGTILIDGHNIATLQQNALRNAISLVSQETYLVDGTIAENIMYGTFDARRDEIIYAATMAEAHSFIMRLPEGYDTRVEEQGKNLSGGQRQRISIARAILKRAPILIFDEATSAVDNETETAIQRSFGNLAHHHTMIIVAHRLSTIRHADAIYVMQNGSIVEVGNHDELIKKDGAYATLWNLQLGGL